MDQINSQRITIQLNGEPYEISARASVRSLLDVLGIEPRKIAVERNLEIVPKSAYGVTRLCVGDRVEIVRFVGGG